MTRPREEPPWGDKERDLIKQMFRGFFPSSPPIVPGIAMAWECLPANPEKPVTGDFLRAHVAEDDCLHFVIGDVSGKGLKAARLSVAVVNMWDHFVSAQPHPAQVLRWLNKAIPFNLEEDQFITVACGCIDLASGAMMIARAGHPPPLLLRSTGRVEPIEAEGIPLGIRDDWEYSAREDRLHKGDALLLYTDGLCELQRERESERELLGIEGVAAWLEKHGHLHPKQLTTQILEEAQSWSEAGFHDDIALCALKRTA